MRAVHLLIAWLCLTAAAAAQGEWRQIAHLSVPVNDIFFLDRDHGWIAHGEQVLRTENGGITWDTIYRASEAGWQSFTRLMFVDRSTGWGWVTGGRGPSRTDDGGRTWIDQTAKIPDEPPQGGDPVEINDCFFINRDTGWAVGNYLMILMTTDGGEHWRLRTVDWKDRGYFIRFDDVEFSDPLHGIAVGGTQVGTVAWTSDGGVTWHGDLNTDSSAGGTQSTVSMPDARHAFAPEYELGTLWRTGDGGATWESKAIDGASDIMDVAFTDSLNGWMLDHTHTPGPGTNILASSDGGETWHVSHAVESRYLDYLSFPAADVGYAAGYSGMVWKYEAASGMREERGMDEGIAATAEPNPADDRARIVIRLPRPSRVRVRLYDLFGRAASTLSDAELDAGRHALEVPTSALPSGLYRYRIESDAASGGGTLLVRH